MRTLIGVLIVCLLGFSPIANASIDGKWIGWADWSYDGGKGTRCTANLAFLDTHDTFDFQKGFLDCDIIIMDIPQRIFSKKNNLLFLGNEAVGKWSANQFEWKERYNERTVIHVSIVIEGSHMDYVEHWIQDENKTLYDIKGRLFREPRLINHP